MITINLLTPGRRRPAALPRATIAVVGGVIAVFVILLAVTVYLGSRASSLHAQLNNVNRQLDTLRPLAQQVERLDLSIKALEARQARLKELLAIQLPASQSLQAVKAVIPSDVWLVNVTTQGGGRNVLFDGYTFTYKSVARFMVALRDSGRFRDVDLTSSSKDTVSDREVVKFQITGGLISRPDKAQDTTHRPEASRPRDSAPGHLPPRTPE